MSPNIEKISSTLNELEVFLKNVKSAIYKLDNEQDSNLIPEVRCGLSSSGLLFVYLDIRSPAKDILEIKQIVAAVVQQNFKNILSQIEIAIKTKIQSQLIPELESEIKIFSDKINDLKSGYVGAMSFEYEKLDDQEE